MALPYINSMDCSEAARQQGKKNGNVLCSYVGDWFDRYAAGCQLESQEHAGAEVITETKRARGNEMRAFYVMAEIQGSQLTYWHSLFECETMKEAQETITVLPLMHGEIQRRIVPGKASGDCRELRPC